MRNLSKLNNKIVFIIVAAIILTISLTIPPARFGDGYEYLGMTISFSNHASPDLRAEDIEERASLAFQAPGLGWDLSPTYDHLGYYEALNGREYCYHFWGYSLLCVIPYFLLKAFNILPLKVFLMTNTLLVLLLLWWILFNTNLSNKAKYWLLLVTMVSPMCLYIPWPHPEVFSFVFLFIGLLEVMNNRKFLASVFIAVASLQNPAIIVVNVFLLVGEIWENRKITNLSWYISSSFIIASLPYVFYWLNYRKLSLITDTFASVNFITIPKVLSIFVDPNFGLIIYVPVLLMVLIWLTFKRNLNATWGLILLILMAIICATQLNWNSGMMYINRYCVWMIPVLIIATLNYFISLTKTKLVVYSIIYLLTTGTIFLLCIVEYDPANYVRFSPLTKRVLVVAPSLYNPPPEVFIERTIGAEGPFYDKNLVVATNEGVRKSLYYDPLTGFYGYTNGPVRFSTERNLIVFRNPSGDIVSGVDIISFIEGWYDLETNDGAIWRWTNGDAHLVFLSDYVRDNATVKITLSSFLIHRKCDIIINDMTTEMVITPEPTEFLINVPLNKGVNHLRIVSKDGSRAPNDIKELNNPDTRSLAFCISKIKLE